MVNEIRKDYLSGRYVIMASERAKRPTDYVLRGEELGAEKTCPFCLGNEEMTPPANLVYLSKDGRVIKEKDSETFRHKEWVVRCFPNLYPALSPIGKKFELQGSFPFLRAVGHGSHEIVVESPNHDEQIHNARLGQLELMFGACLDLLRELYDDDLIEYVQIFRNYGKEGGASLSHPHTQIIATPLVPVNILEEIGRARQYYGREKQCIFCRIIEEERQGPRRIHEDGNFLVFAPWASVFPFEFWVIPKRHESNLLDANGFEIREFVKTLRLSLQGLAQLLNDPPYNYGFHIAPRRCVEKECYHWHLEVYPRLSTWAGFELNTGLYINVTPPEIAAESLRESISKLPSQNT